MLKTRFGLPLVIALVVLLTLVILLFSMPSGEAKPKKVDDTEESGENTVKSGEDQDQIEMPQVKFKAELSHYEDHMNLSVEQAQKRGYLMLVNKQNTVGEELAPSDLVAVRHARKDITLRRDAEMALEAMFLEMKAEGIEGVYVTSAYRSYAYQVWLFDYYIGLEMDKAPSLSREEAIEKVLRYSAEPGTSEHQIGLSVDLMCDGMDGLDESFASYPVYAWLCENAWKFGFVLRFPADKTGLTGYDYEPWHYRFVGRAAAYEMTSTGRCLEEYAEREGAF